MAEAGSTSYIITMRSTGEEDIEAGITSVHMNDTERNVSNVESPLENFADDGNDNGEAIEIEKWANSLEYLIEDMPHYMFERAHPGRITKIPETLRMGNVNAYEPYILSIGPYHHGKANVQFMQKKKHAALKCFLEHKPELNLKDCIEGIKSIEPEARRFYSDIDMDDEEFALMLLIDGFYIVTSFCGVPTNERMNHTSSGTRISLQNEETDDDSQHTADGESASAIITNEPNHGTRSAAVRPRWFWLLFIHDILLLENQLPLFVLQKVYNLAYGASEAQFIAILKNIMCYMLSDYAKLDPVIVISPTEEVHHLLHLCHGFFRPTFQQRTPTHHSAKSSQMFRLGSVVQLYEAGINFKARSRSTQHSLLDITFSNDRTMVMPCLCVDDNTGSLLRNLIAFEQMKYPSMGLNVSAYVVLLLHLITTPEDVELLRTKGIIQHHLASDKEMMHLINQLSVGLAFDYVEDSYSLKPVFQELRRYTEHKVPRWRAWLKHRYFNNPWATISLLAASILLFLSALQTYYSVLSYYQPY